MYQVLQDIFINTTNDDSDFKGLKQVVESKLNFLFGFDPLLLTTDKHLFNFILIHYLKSLAPGWLNAYFKPDLTNFLPLFQVWMSV